MTTMMFYAAEYPKGHSRVIRIGGALGIGEKFLGWTQGIWLADPWEFNSPGMTVTPPVLPQEEVAGGN